MTVVFLGFFGVGMSIAFKRLRPIFRERSIITAEVTGRLTETIGGIRLIKVYTAEEREKAVFGAGVQRLFQNMPKPSPARHSPARWDWQSSGVIGLIAMYVGGRDVINGAMTVGGLITFVFFIAMVTLPLVQIASIGTQITEAFAGLDRIRELRDMATEDQEDAERRHPCPPWWATWSSRRCGSSTRRTCRSSRDVNFTAPPARRRHWWARAARERARSSRSSWRLRNRSRGACWSTASRSRELKLRDYRRHLGVVMQDNFLFDGTVAKTSRSRKPGATDEEVQAVAKIANAHEFIMGFPQNSTTRSSVNAASSCRAASASAWPLRARSSPIRACSSSTKPRRHWTAKASS